ncbi:MAG: tetratricopeptide repeat protein [Armatimonadota bacterium]
MRSRFVIAGLMALLFSGMCIIENSAVSCRPRTQMDSNTSSVYILAGEFRTVFANLLWIKAEQYHHEYLARSSDWSKNKELLGLITLITKLDPHFPEAYAVGTYLYAYGLKDNRQAIKYILEGIYNNPKEWELHQIAAIMYTRLAHDPERAIQQAKLALKYCDDEFYRNTTRKLLRTVERMAKEQRCEQAREQDK